MEVNITELDNINPYNVFDSGMLQEEQPINYWENSVKSKTKEKVKKVSFNDILTNMNLVVNKEGVLQSMIPNKQDNAKQSVYLEQNYLSQASPQWAPQNTSQSHVNMSREDALQPTTTHSYIYNKYFKDYVAVNAEPSKPRVPQTIEEYRKMLLEDKINAIKNKKKIEEIKSKKLIFTTVPGANANPRNIMASKNHLRTMNFG